MPIEELMRSDSVRSIVRWGVPVMHTPTRTVCDFGPSLQTLIADMFATNLAADRTSLPAPQVGVDLAVFVFDCFDSATSRGERNKLSEFLHRHHIVKCRSWSSVEASLDALQIAGGERGQISSLRHVLAKESVGVLVRSALPR